MQTDRIEKQKISSYFQSVPKRSLSYNDLKKKRLLRSQKSKTKLKPDSSERLIVRTQKKKTSQQFSIGISATSSKPNDMKKIERSINQLKDVFDDLKQKSKTNKYMISKPFYTDRIVNNKKTSFIEKSGVNNEKINALYESVDMAGNEKELIKMIIQKKKSQRRLIKFDQIRAQLKRSKSKSKLKLLENSTTDNTNIVNSSSQQRLQNSRTKKNLRVNKFETVKQKPMTVSVTQRPSNTEAVQKYPTIQIMNKQNLGIKSQYRSRRKLKINDFKTQRRQIDIKQSGESEFKVKFHRKLRKTNSQIVIKTKQIMYDKSKYMSKMQNKSIIAKSAEKQFFSNEKSQKQQQFSKQNNKETNLKINDLNLRPRSHNENLSSLNQLKDLQFSDINISHIEIRKQISMNDIENELNILQVIQAQELEIQMKKAKPLELQTQFRKFKKILKSSKQSNKNFQMRSYQIENAENIENLSNILDFIALPTKQLKVKINKCSTKIGKKKNELEKFKKIFPMNFFNN